MMRVLSRILALLAISAFVVSCVVWHNTRYVEDGGLAFGIATLALTFAVVSVSARRAAKLTRNPPKDAMATFRSLSIKSVVFSISLIAIWGSALSMWGAFWLCNQEYLHWFPVDLGRSFGTIPVSSMIVEYSVLGVLSGTIGVFLIWFLCFHRPPDAGHGMDVASCADQSQFANP